MIYNVKSEIYKEGLPFNKWFHYDSDSKKSVKDLIDSLGIENEKIGLIIVNDYPKSNSFVLKDRDTVRIVGKIYPEYL